MSKKKLYTVSTSIYHTNYIEAESDLEAEQKTKDMLNDVLDDSFNVDTTESQWIEDDNQFMVTTTIYHMNYIEAASELEAEKLAKNELLDRLDDSYNVDKSEVVASEPISKTK